MYSRKRLEAAMEFFVQMGFRRTSLVIEVGGPTYLKTVVPFVQAIHFEDCFRRFFNQEPPFPKRPQKTGVFIYEIS